LPCSGGSNAAYFGIIDHFKQPEEHGGDNHTAGVLLTPGERLRARLAGFATDCVTHGDMTPNTKRLLLIIVDEEIAKHRGGKPFQCWKAADKHGVPCTCLLPDGHDGDCHWTPDDQVNQG
jgi:hypothetical protein